MNKEQHNQIEKRLKRIERSIRESRKILLPLKKAIRYTGFSKSHLYKLTHNQEIPYYKPEGKKIYFLKRDLDRYLLRNRIATKEEIDNKAQKILAKLK